MTALRHKSAEFQIINFRRKSAITGSSRGMSQLRTPRRVPSVNASADLNNAPYYSNQKRDLHRLSEL